MATKYVLFIGVVYKDVLTINRCIKALYRKFLFRDGQLMCAERADCCVNSTIKTLIKAIARVCFKRVDYVSFSNRNYSQSKKFAENESNM